jgi:hypothetical protein
VAVAIAYTIRQLLLDLGLYLKDSKLLVATGTASANTRFRTSYLDAQTVSTLGESEFFPWDVPAGAATNDTRLPYVVLDNLVSTNMELVLDHAAYSLPFVAGNRGVLSNFAGRGYPQDQKEWALKMASLEVDNPIVQAYATIATPNTTDYWNALPAGLRSVYRVTYYDASVPEEAEIAPAIWQDRLDVAGRRINLPFAWTGTDAARIYGTIDQTLWWDSLRNVVAAGDGGANMATYAQTLYGDERKLIMAAVPWLLTGKGNEAAMQQAQFNYQRRLREAMQRPRANEVWLE